MPPLININTLLPSQPSPFYANSPISFLLTVDIDNPGEADVLGLSLNGITWGDGTTSAMGTDLNPDFGLPSPMTGFFPSVTQTFTHTFATPDPFEITDSLTLVSSEVSGCPGTVADDECFTTVTFTDNIVVSSVLMSTPLPSTLPLFASGLGVVGLLNRRRRRRAAALAA